MRELTLQETASRIGKHYITTMKLIHKGYLRAIRRGGQWYIREEEVERFLREGNYVPPSETKEEEDA